MLHMTAVAAALAITHARRTSQETSQRNADAGIAEESTPTHPDASGRNGGG